MAGADLSHCQFQNTSVTLCEDLHLATGLTTINHGGPSVIDQHTIRASLAELPDAFIQGIGYSLEEIDYFRSMSRRGLTFYSCFLSHAQNDSAFADRLRAELMAHDVTCWHYRYDMQGGKHWRTQIETAIKLHDKLILICSRESVLRPNVVSEIVSAIERERETGSQKLFPIRIDEFILSPELLQIADAKMECGEWREDWVRYVRSYHIPDFTEWTDPAVWFVECTKLLRDLKDPNPRPRT